MKKSLRTFFRHDEIFKKRLKEISKLEDRPMSDQIRHMCNQYMIKKLNAFYVLKKRRGVHAS